MAAAGGHHLLFTGPPGSGKTMLAERLPGVLPPLVVEEALEVTAVHSVAGLLAADAPLVRRPPYQAPHHSASAAALVGGGSRQARPGAASLSHRGMLFLDEAPEFQAGVLDALRQPLESGEVAIARSGGVARYPARFQLVLAANPCPCAAPAGEAECRCTSTARRRYLGRISGPLLDRMDLQVQLEPVVPGELLDGLDAAEPSRGGGVPGGGGAGGRGRAAARHRLADQRGRARSGAAQPVAAAGRGDRGGRRPPRPRRAERPRLRPGAAGRLDASSDLAGPTRPDRDRRRGGRRPCAATGARGDRARPCGRRRCGWRGHG